MANPETCRHNVVVIASITEKITVVCVSCKTDVSDPEKRVGKNYIYNTHYGTWEHIPASRAEDTDKLEPAPKNEFTPEFFEWTERYAELRRKVLSEWKPQINIPDSGVERSQARTDSKD